MTVSDIGLRLRSFVWMWGDAREDWTSRQDVCAAFWWWDQWQSSTNPRLGPQATRKKFHEIPRTSFTGKAGSTSWRSMEDAFLWRSRWFASDYDVCSETRLLYHVPTTLKWSGPPWRYCSGLSFLLLVQAVGKCGLMGDRTAMTWCSSQDVRHARWFQPRLCSSQWWTRILSAIGWRTFWRPFLYRLLMAVEMPNSTVGQMLLEVDTLWVQNWHRCQVWFPMTVCTNSRYQKISIQKYLEDCYTPED